MEAPADPAGHEQDSGHSGVLRDRVRVGGHALGGGGSSHDRIGKNKALIGPAKGKDQSVLCFHAQKLDPTLFRAMRRNTRPSGTSTNRGRGHRGRRGRWPRGCSRPGPRRSRAARSSTRYASTLSADLATRRRPAPDDGAGGRARGDRVSRACAKHALPRPRAGRAAGWPHSAASPTAAASPYAPVQWSAQAGESASPARAGTSAGSREAPTHGRPGPVGAGVRPCEPSRSERTPAALPSSRRPCGAPGCGRPSCEAPFGRPPSSVSPGEQSPCAPSSCGSPCELVLPSPISPRKSQRQNQAPAVL